MNNTGVIEGFFGPQWPHEARVSYASFLKTYGGGFYIYAPKQDGNLRKNWRSHWDEEYLLYLKNLVSVFHLEGIKFGVGFSPFGLGSSLSHDDSHHLKEKLEILNTLKIDILGLFFDDMPVNDQLAQTQINALKFVKESFSGKIIFCPSYYTPDPILDKVFGPRPHGYLEELAAQIPLDVSIAWTGPQVISPEISAEHLAETSSLLRRKPFIWENLYANDGPKNCKFLKLKPFMGRDQNTFKAAEAFGLNMMNQPYLSQIVYLSSVLVLEGESDQEKAFRDAVAIICSVEFGKFLVKNREVFLNTGLDNLKEDDKLHFLKELSTHSDPQAREIEGWLKGHYLVGSECLTD